MSDVFRYLSEATEEFTQHHNARPISVIGDSQFAKFHRANPHIYEGLKRLALDARQCGVRRLGIQLLIEKMRYDHAIDTKGDDLKINNNYSASYARLLMVNNSELIGFFETRKSKADDQ